MRAILVSPEQLGDRLVKESSPALFEAAIISYVCAGSASSLLGAWRARGTRDRVALTQLALLVRRAAACRRAEPQVLSHVTLLQYPLKKKSSIIDDVKVTHHLEHLQLCKDITSLIVL